MGFIGCIVSELKQGLRFTFVNNGGTKKAREPKRAGL
jgi:hypothetical protein